MTRALRVCLHAPLLWPLWSGGRIAFTGGAEVQQARIARGLVARGCAVTVVTCDYGQPESTVVHGVRVLRTYRLDAGLPGLRFFHPRLSRAFAALTAADADVYYVRGASLEVGTTFEVARARNAGFVFAAAHDLDADPTLPLLSNPRDRLWYRRGLAGARAVIAQSFAQQQAFRTGFRRESTVIPNLVEAPQCAADPGHDGPIVWLATYKTAKRPDWFVQLARALPQQRFIMCGVVPIPPETPQAW
ncbi:MAG: glycosyltransferase family 4 protein, partial [Candidatus Eisenbacteria bacterium]